MIAEGEEAVRTKRHSAPREKTPAVSAKGLVYRFGTTTAVASVDFGVALREV